MSKHDDDNHANQMNPNNDAYWESRGYDGRPDDWETNPGNDLQREVVLNPNNDLYYQSRGEPGRPDDSNRW